MPTARRRRRAASLTRAAELCVLTPQVMALRALRMHDPLEMQRMATEKVFAFWECAAAMSLQLAKASPWVSPWHSAAIATRMLEEGMRPIHRRASANARRLRRRR